MDIKLPGDNFWVNNLVDLLRYRARTQPESLAYRFLSLDKGEETLTYAQLDARAKVIAHHMQLHSPTNARAILIYKPGLDLITAYFGCLYAGIICVPVYPPANEKLVQKLQLIINDAKPSLILCTEETFATIQKLKLIKWAGKIPLLKRAVAQFMHRAKTLSSWDLEKIPVLTTDNLAWDLAQNWQMPVLDSNHLAFLQYTSGSTGNPKGVMLSHGNLMHNLQLIHDCFAIKPHSIGFNWLPPYHDMGLIGGILEPLFMGAVGNLMSPLHFVQEPFAWLEGITRYGATVSGGPNFAYDYCAKKITAEQKTKLDLSCWEVAFNGAEPIHHATLERFAKAFASCGFRRQALYPCYGLAEASLMVAGAKQGEGYVAELFSADELQNNKLQIADETAAKVSMLVSSGLPAQTLQIVNPQSLQICKPDEVGEIWVTSPSVAQGYWQKSETTQAIFQAQLNDDKTHARYLRTGDLGFIHEGQLYVTGRLADLIIIHGRNYYPQDIEQSVARAHKKIRSGCCAAFSAQFDQEEHLLIVCEINVSSPADHSVYLDICEAIEHALEHEHQLAAHTIALIAAKSLPKTTSGKIRRNYTRELLLTERLATLYIWKQQAYPSQHQYQAPTKPEEEQLCTIISQLLNQEKVGITDSLFHLGADSLLVAQLSHRIWEQFQIRLEPEAIFDNPTVQQLAKLLTSKAEQPSSLFETISPRKNNANIPLSYSQQQLWFIEQLLHNKPLYNLTVSISLTGKLNKHAFYQALSIITQRHEILRTTFSAKDGVPYQSIHAKGELNFTELDLSLYNPAEQKRSLNKRVKIESHRPFDLEKGPLTRYILFKLEEERFNFLVVIHHIIADGWSLNVYAQEFSHIYQSLISGQAIDLPNLPLQYADYSVWERSIPLTSFPKSLNFWRQNLAGVPATLDLPTDFPRPLQPSHAGAKHIFRVSNSLTQKLKRLANTNNCSLYTVLLAGFSVLLYRYSSQKDFIIGSPTMGRDQPVLEPLLGFFSKTIPLTFHINPSESFLEHLHQIRKNFFSAMAHQAIPLDELVKLSGVERIDGTSPLFQVMFSLQNKNLPQLKLPELEAKLFTDTVMAKFNLTLDLTETIQGLAGYFEYATELFHQTTIEHLAKHFKQLLYRIVQNPLAKLEQINFLTAAENQLLLEDWNKTEAAYPQTKTLSQLFTEQVAKTPQALAVVYEDEHLTYYALNQRANQLAHYLISLGVKPDTLVAICLARSLELLISVLAILKAGGAYVPLAPNDPTERLAFMLEDTQATLLLTQMAYQTRYDFYRGAVIAVDEPEIQRILAAQPTTAPSIKLKASDLAYVIYTSGSTGKPKGVMIEHRSVINFLTSMQPILALSPTDCWLSATSIGFDIAGLELYLPLSQGACVELVSDEATRDGERLKALLDKPTTTVFQATPARWRLLLESGWLPRANLKLLCGGEPLTPNLLAKLTARGQRLHHVYGPTETTIWSTHTLLAADSLITLGRPLANTRLYVLDKALQPVPIGVPGELYIGGAGLARGYLNRPELTQERFIANPFAADKEDTRLYKTGDIVRYLPDGTIQYLGRSDFQVKLRGMRIELGEIESLLQKQPQVQDAVVIVQGQVETNQRLIAYVVCKSDLAKSSETILAELQEKLKANLPSHMVPAQLIRLEKMPLNANGKIARQALPLPQLNLTKSTNSHFTTPLEKQLAAYWEELLQQPITGPQANFFGLGGHSLLAVQLIAYVKHNFAIVLPMTSIFQHPELGDFAKLIAKARKQTNKNLNLVKARRRQDQLHPLSFSQQFIFELEGTSVAAAQQVNINYEIEGPLQVEALQYALNHLVERHEGLRTLFTIRDKEPKQYILPKLKLDISVIDLSHLEQTEQQREITRQLESFTQQPLELAQNPFIHSLILKLNPNKHIWSYRFHHIILDAWSAGIFWRELVHIYNATINNRTNELPPVKWQPIDYANWQAKGMTAARLKQAHSFWQSYLSKSTVLLLPQDHMTSKEKTLNTRHYTVISAAEFSKLKDLAKTYNTTLSFLVMALFVKALSQWTQKTDVLLAAYLANRDQTETQDIVGCFVSIIPLRFKIDPEADTATNIKNICETVLPALQYGQLPLQQILEFSSSAHSLTNEDLFNIGFNYVSVYTEAQKYNLENLVLNPIYKKESHSIFNFMLAAVDMHDHLRLLYSYRADQFDASTITQFAAMLEGLIQDLN